MVQFRPDSPAAQEDYDHIDYPSLRSDEEDWVDENEEHDNGRGWQPKRPIAAQGITSSALKPGAAHSSPRKRRKPTRAPSRSPKASSSFQFPTASSLPPPPVPKSSEEIQNEWQATREATPSPPIVLPRKEEVMHHAFAGVKWIINYTFSIVRPAVSFLRFPLRFILFLFLVAAILNRVSSTLSSAFSPLCYVPGLSFTPMCRWITRPPPPSQNVLWSDYPSLMDVQSRTFNQLIDDSVGSSSLSLDIKKTEIATADLVALVRLSDLASKESLANTLGEFINDAKNTGRSLHRLEAKMNGAIDSIMAMNDFALHAIEGARAKESSAMGSLMIWKPKKTPEQVVRETFSDAMDVLSDHLARLILELESNYENLESLEEKLSTLRDIVGRENKTVAAAKEELLENLWTMLGGNRKDLRNFDRNLKMLQDLTAYRKHASAHVVATLHALQGVSQDMEDMRERVAAPNLAGSKIAPEVHIKSIKNGLERLKEGRTRAKKMEEAALRRALGA